MQRNDKTKDLPIYKKGEEIYELVSKIVDLIPENNPELQMVKKEILTDSLLLMVKVVGAEAGALYDVKMECATIIRKAAHNLIVQYHNLEMFNFEEVEYYKMVRDLVEEYRLLFIDWVASFDQSNYMIDRWGLFNPPGVNPDDAGPDDDIPFNPDDFNFED